MKINIKILNGQECTFDVHTGMKVAELKNLVFGAFNVPVKDQRLLLTGRPLCDEKALTEYPQIKEGTRLNLVVKQQLPIIKKLKN